MPFQLKVISAPDPAQAGRKLNLKTGDNVVGRVAPVCDLHLEGAKVSKKHCNIKVQANDKLSIEDLKSSNGVFVNGKQISTEILLHEKDRIVIGEYVLEVVVKQ